MKNLKYLIITFFLLNLNLSNAEEINVLDNTVTHTRGIEISWGVPLLWGT